MKKSIITDEMEYCYMCGSPRNIEIHHVFYGTGNRKQSDFFGLVVPLCHWCHNEAPIGVHFNKVYDMKLKQEAQKIFEEKYSHEQFMQVFGRNYL